MIVSFKNYLNKSQDENNIDWTQIETKETEETRVDKKSFSKDDILKSKKYKKNIMNTNKKDKLQNEIKTRKKHMLPYTHDVDQKEMSHIEKTNPALYAALTSWN